MPVLRHALLPLVQKNAFVNIYTLVRDLVGLSDSEVMYRFSLFYCVLAFIMLIILFFRPIL